MEDQNRIGTYIKSSAAAGESCNAYMPPPLPPEPPLNLDTKNLNVLLSEADNALGRLDGMSTVLPNLELFLYMYVRKEAVVSSQIEGTQSSLSDLLLFENSEAPGAPMEDVTEVSCYVSAMDYGLKRLKELPFSLRLIKEIHKKLMNNTRGSHQSPGEFRSSQNWIGGTKPSNARFVPPPPDKLMECLDHFEKFLHKDHVKLPVLIKTALMHVQFETIHPFLDGNGRMGRLMIPLILHSKGLLEAPLLYLSLYFKTNRQTYYDHLQSVRKTGDWESWVEFFLTGVKDTARQATETAKSIVKLFNHNSDIILSRKSATSIPAIHRYLQQQPLADTASIRKKTGLSQPTVMRSLAALEELGIVKEITGRERHKIFVYRQYLNILEQGTEPLKQKEYT